MTRRYIDQQVLDLAVRKSLEYNSSSSVMFLLRERMIREIIEVATPIVTKPLVDRIKELEEQLGNAPTVSPETVKIPQPVKMPSEKLKKLREALDEMVDVIDEE
jgi:hypothetical protein